MDTARHVSNLMVNTVDGKLHSLMIQLTPTTDGSKSARVEEVDDEVEAPLDAPATSMLDQEEVNKQAVAATDAAVIPSSAFRTVSPPPPSQERDMPNPEKSSEKVETEDEDEDDAKHPLTAGDQDGPVLHQDRRRKSEYGALPFPAPKPQLRYAKLKPTPKPRLHLRKGAASDLARIKDAHDTWGDKHMDRAFDLILDADGLKTLIVDKAEVSAEILTELEEEEEMHPCLNPPEELENAKEMALQFHYLRWQHHVGMFDFPPSTLSPKMVDRLIKAQLIDHASLDFPTGLTLLARGAYERYLRTELFPGPEARSIPPSERWTISPDEHPPTVREISEFIQAKEISRQVEPISALEKYDLPAVARPSISSAWLPKHEQKHGIYGLKSIGITDEEAAEMICEEDLAFFPPDDERPYSAGQDVVNTAAAVHARTSATNTEATVREEIYASENNIADATEAERANASTQEEDSARIVSPSVEPNETDASGNGHGLDPPVAPAEQENPKPVVLRRSNRFQERTPAAKATARPLANAQPCADKPASSARHVRSISTARKSGEESASAIRAPTSSARAKRGRRKAPTKTPAKAKETQHTRKRARDAPETKASSDPKQEPAGKAVNDVAGRPAKKRKMESKTEAESTQQLRRSKRNQKH